MFKVIAFGLFIIAVVTLVPVIVPFLLILSAMSACLMGLFILASAFTDDAKEARRRQHELNARRHESPVKPTESKSSDFDWGD